jgi:anthranilate synthase component 2
MKKILVIDNYDSFVYNLVYYIEQITGVKPSVFRNDEISLDEAGAFDKILLSPGPGIPSEAGLCLSLIKRYASSKSIFGVCLGHQAIGEAFGANLTNLENVYHGVSTPVKVTDENEYIFKEMPSSFIAGRYHSWVIDPVDLPESLKITCIDENGLIMGISHREYDVRGLQFHPESVLTENGFSLIRNWINQG